MSDQILAFRRLPAAERANALTHGVGMALSVVGLCALVAYAQDTGDGRLLAAVTVFGASMVLLYLASTLYHAVGEPSLKRVFKFIDHVAIYVLIAGTYTPFTLITIRDNGGWTLFCIVWSLALAGILFKALCFDRYELVSVGFYLLMGWLGVVVAKPVLAAIPATGVALLVTGGLLYTFGVIFFLYERIPHHHAIWHVCVMAGTFCHFATVFWFVLP